MSYTLSTLTIQPASEDYRDEFPEVVQKRLARLRARHDLQVAAASETGQPAPDPLPWESPEELFTLLLAEYAGKLGDEWVKAERELQKKAFEQAPSKSHRDLAQAVLMNPAAVRQKMILEAQNLGWDSTDAEKLADALLAAPTE